MYAALSSQPGTPVESELPIARAGVSLVSSDFREEPQIHAVAPIITSSGRAAVAEELSAFSSTHNARLLDEWARRYRAALLSFFRRRLPRGADEEDLVQEVFLRLSRRGDLEAVRNADAYVFQAAGNTLKDWGRRQSVRPPSGSGGELDGNIRDEAQPTPEQNVISHQRMQALLAILDALPARTRSVFVLYHFEHYPHAEIAARLGIAVRTVEDHVARANIRLSAALSHDD